MQTTQVIYQRRTPAKRLPPAREREVEQQAILGHVARRAPAQGGTVKLAATTARLASALSLVRATERGRYARRIKLILRWIASPIHGTAAAKAVGEVL